MSRGRRYRFVFVLCGWLSPAVGFPTCMARMQAERACSARREHRMWTEQDWQGFFGALNLDYPGLERTKELVEAGELESAKSAFVDYIKSRRRPRYFVDWRQMPGPHERPETPHVSRAAQDALQLKYTVCGIPHRFHGEIDWTANPTDPFDPEWTWQLGRFHWWRDLGRAYWESGDGKYARQFVRELRSWIGSNPMPEGCDNSVGSRWRTIECGIRLCGSWPMAFYHFLPSPSFTDDDVVMMIASMAQQAEYLHRYPQGGNWLTMEANGMGHVGVLFPEFKRAEAWRGDAIARLHRELDEQVYPDGVQKELTSGYHYVSLNNFLGLARICLLNHVLLPEDYIPKLERMWAAGMWAMMPDRSLPLVNDAWHVDVPATLRTALEYFPEREDFRWMATDGRNGTPPDHLSHFFPWAGWAVMRSGWGRQDNYLFFDVGPFGMGHQHEDKLSFIIHAHGHCLLRDVGSYAYERSPMRSYVLSPYAHNTVLVDGKGQRRRGQRHTYVNQQPQHNPWQNTETLDFCQGVYEDGFGEQVDRTVTHRRAILFVKPEYWIVQDTLEPRDGEPHSYRALFHLGAEEAVAEGPRARTLRDGANLHIFAAGEDLHAQIIKGQTEPHYLGWVGVHGRHGKRPMPVACFDWKATGNSTVLYVFYPTRPGEQSPVKALDTLPGNEGLRAALVFEDGRRDIISIADDTWQVKRLNADSSTAAVLSVQP